MIIQKLPETVKKVGLEFKLIKRTDNVLMYGSKDSIEVFKNKIVQKMNNEKAQELGWKPHDGKFSHKEVYPASEEFGARAWCYRDMNSAHKRFEILNSMADAAEGLKSISITGNREIEEV